MRTLILNSSNIIQDGQNNKLVYKFPNSATFKNSSIALASCTMYYSWFNIRAEYGNNIFTYNWVSGVTTTTYTITIPDGLYEIDTLNKLLQYNFIQNGHYLRDSNGDNVYYAEFLVNPARYAVQINTYLFPISLPAGWSNPASLVFPIQSFNPVITLPAKINLILGYAPAPFATAQNTNNTYTPPVGSTTISKLANGTISYISTQSPNVQPNSSLLVSISNIDNDLANPTSIIYTVVPNVGIGELITERPSEFIWTKMLQGTYNEIRVTLLGTDLQPIRINDPSMTFVFVIKENF